jgi:nucleoside-diphosphate-sugar epimerase
MAKVLIIGCGDVGSTLGLALLAAGNQVWGLRRNTANLPPGIQPLAADLLAEEALPVFPTALDYVFFTGAAERRDEATYRGLYVAGLGRVLDALVAARQWPRRVFFTSSTGVYAQTDGSWVDEGSPTEPQSFTGRCMLEAEERLKASPFPSTNVRLGGIYGPGREGLLRRIRAGEPVQKDPPLYSNRIHRDDCVGLLLHLMRLPRTREIYIGVDRDPASQYDIVCWLRRAMGLPDLDSTRSATEALAAGHQITKGHRARHRSNKRCNNRRLLATGYEFLYPTFRQGYGSLLGLPDFASAP